MTGQIVSADWVVTAALDPPRANPAVRAPDGLITDVGPTPHLEAGFPDDPVHRGSDQVLMPGFVNAHVHMYGVLAHGVPADEAPSDFWSFLDDHWWPKVENALDHDMIRAATDWVCAEMVLSGTTTFYDILEAPRALPEALLVEKEVVDHRGPRAILSFEATERISPANGQAGLDENVGLIEAARADPAGRVSGAMCYHTTFTCPEPFIRRAFELATEHDVFCHAHCNEGVHEGEWCEKHLGQRTLEFYDRIGVAGPRFLASQCVQLSPREIEIVARSGTRVTHMPLANCEVGGGIAPMPELLDRGVTVGLGSDGYINDMYEVMRGAFLLHKARTMNPGIMPAPLVLHLATEGGAKALGLDGVGRLEPGWKADLQLMDGAFPTPVTGHNLADQLVLWRNHTHVRDVMVGGDWLVTGGEVLGADLEAMRARTLEQARRLWS